MSHLGNRVALAVLVATVGWVLATGETFGADRGGSDARLNGSPEKDGGLWVLSRPIRRGEVLGPEDVVPQRRDPRSVPPGALMDPSEVMGMRALRSLQSGAVLQRDQWKPVPVVKKGQRVTIVLDTGLMRLVTTGETLEEGGPGERIRVLNTSSRQVVVARVNDAQSVRVEF
jgi:flagellar basal body P-ring formation protein FlgA